MVVLDPHQQQQQSQHPPSSQIQHQQPVGPTSGHGGPTAQGLVTIDSCSMAGVPLPMLPSQMHLATMSNGLPGNGLSSLGALGPQAASAASVLNSSNLSLLTGTIMNSSSAGLGLGVAPLSIPATNGGLGNICDYYPSPTSTTTETTESSASAIPPCRSQAPYHGPLQPHSRSIHLLDGQSDNSSTTTASPHPPQESTGRYPEYKH